MKNKTPGKITTTTTSAMDVDRPASALPTTSRTLGSPADPSPDDQFFDLSFLDQDPLDDDPITKAAMQIMTQMRSGAGEGDPYTQLLSALERPAPVGGSATTPTELASTASVWPAAASTASAPTPTAHSLVPLVILALSMHKNIQNRALAAKILSEAAHLPQDLFFPLCQWGSMIPLDDRTHITDFVRTLVISLALRTKTKYLISILLNPVSVEQYLIGHGADTQQYINLIIRSTDRAAISILLGLGKKLGDFFYTQLQPLYTHSFTITQLVAVLANNGGSHNLAALQALLQPLDPGDPTQGTQLTALLQAGFTTEQLVAVLANNGGSHNLAALQALLQPLNPVDPTQGTQLTALLQAGFTTKQLVAVLANNGGSHNLAALQALLQPSPIDPTQGTQLTALLQAGFTTEQLVAVLAE